MISCEFHVPLSPTPAFANMLFFLVQSIARNARLPGPWKLIATLSRDGDLTAASPEFAWAKDFPVEFRAVDQALWDRFHAESRQRNWPTHEYSATALHALTHGYDSDAVIFMDADTLVTGPIGKIVRRAFEGDCLCAKPAYKLPAVDINRILAMRGCVYDGPLVTFDGYGWEKNTPRHGPPYFNYGFIACSKRIAGLLASHLPAELEFVWTTRFSKLDWQIALCIFIIKYGIPFKALPNKFNFGNGTYEAPTMAIPESAEIHRTMLANAADIRVLHYCVPSEYFSRETTMGDPAAIAHFCQMDGLTDGMAALQRGLTPLLELFTRHAAENLGLRL